MSAAGVAIEELARLPGTLAACWRHVFLQVRRGPLTEDVFDRVS